MSYIDKEELIQRMQDTAPMNWTDTDFELGEEWQYKSDMEVIESCAEVNAIPIPPEATNGDMIKALFSHYDIEIDEHKCYVRIFYEDFYTTYPLRWWNAPYRKE